MEDEEFMGTESVTGFDSNVELHEHGQMRFAIRSERTMHQNGQEGCTKKSHPDKICARVCGAAFCVSPAIPRSPVREEYFHVAAHECSSAVKPSLNRTHELAHARHMTEGCQRHHEGVASQAPVLHARRFKTA